MTSRFRQAFSWRANQIRQHVQCFGLPGDVDRVAALYGEWRKDCRWRRLCFQHDDDLGWRFIPEQHARLPHHGGFYVHRTNGAGLRSDKDYPDEKASGRTRIVVLGDSYTAGDGVSNGKRFSDLIEQRHPHMDTINLGLPGAGPDQQLLLMEQMGLKYRPDLLVWCVTCENIRRLGCRSWPALEWSTGRMCYRAKPYMTLEDGELRVHNVPTPRGMRFEGELGDWDGEASHVFAGSFSYDVYSRPDDMLNRLMEAVVLRLLKSTTGTPVLIVPLPVKNFILGEAPVYMPFFDVFHDPSTQRYVADILPAFAALGAEDKHRCWFRTDPHYTPFAHRIVADFLLRVLGERFPALLDGDTPSTAEES